MSEFESLNLLSLVRETRGALVKCDSGTLERLAGRCESLVAGLEGAWDGSGFLRQPKGVEEFRRFGRLLQNTELSLDLLRRLTQPRYLQLEYHPSTVTGKEER